MTRDEQIRAAALAAAANPELSVVEVVDIAKDYEDYIRTGSV